MAGKVLGFRKRVIEVTKQRIFDTSLRRVYNGLIG